MKTLADQREGRTMPRPLGASTCLALRRNPPPPGGHTGRGDRAQTPFDRSELHTDTRDRGR